MARLARRRFEAAQNGIARGNCPDQTAPNIQFRRWKIEHGINPYTTVFQFPHAKLVLLLNVLGITR